jgi:hypothetical protein
MATIPYLGTVNLSAEKPEGLQSQPCHSHLQWRIWEIRNRYVGDQWPLGSAEDIAVSGFAITDS